MTIENGSGSPIAVQQSPLIGLGRVAALELPDLRPRMLDLDAAEVLNGRAKSARCC